MNGVGCASKLHAQRRELEPRACSAYQADVCPPATTLELSVAWLCQGA